MNMRERILAVVQGREHDRVPFIQYDNNGGPNDEIWSVIGRENMGLLRWTNIHRVETPNCRTEWREVEENGLKGWYITLHTPEGTLVEERFREPALGTSAARKHYVKDPENYKVLLAYLRDMQVHKDLGEFLRAESELGEDGLPLVETHRTPYQQLWVQWVSLEDLALHMVDCPEVIEEVTSMLADIQRRVCKVIREAMDEVFIPFVDVPDNITAPAIGDRYFSKYCVPMYNELADMLAEKNVPVFVHMDGDLKPLSSAIAASKVGGLDSFSPVPDNDTSVAEALSAWPEKRLWLNFPSSVHLAKPDEIYNQTMRILEEGGRSGRLQIQISENTPPGRWRVSYPPIVKAIQDYFG